MRRRNVPGFLVAAGLGTVVLAGCGGAGPVDRLQAHLELKKGNESYLQGSYETAIQHYQAAVAHVPGEKQAWLNQAYSYVALLRGAGADMEKRRRLATEAVQSFEKYVQYLGDEEPDADSKLPDRERVDQHVLTLYLDSGQPEAAIDFLKARLERNPKDLPALQMLSSISADRGDLVGAADWQRKRLELQPNDPEAHYAFGVFAWRASYYNQTTNVALRDSLVEEGIKELEKALQIQPDYFEALSYMTLLYREKARNAADPAQAALAQARADAYRKRALEVREKSGKTPPEAPAEPPTETSGSLLVPR